MEFAVNSGRKVNSGLKIVTRTTSFAEKLIEKSFNFEKLTKI